MAKEVSPWSVPLVMEAARLSQLAEAKRVVDSLNSERGHIATHSAKLTAKGFRITAVPKSLLKGRDTDGE